jgi:hypothetical protein
MSRMRDHLMRLFQCSPGGRSSWGYQKYVKDEGPFDEVIPVVQEGDLDGVVKSNSYSLEGWP